MIFPQLNKSFSTTLITILVSLSANSATPPSVKRDSIPSGHRASSERAINIQLGAATSEFSLQFGNHVSGNDVVSLFVMPSQQVTFEALFALRPGTIQMSSAGGTLHRVKPGEWRWTAPAEAGHYQLTVESGIGHAVEVNAFVKVPSDQLDSGRLNEFRGFVSQ